jgi:hypothetical protein
LLTLCCTLTLTSYIYFFQLNFCLLFCNETQAFKAKKLLSKAHSVHCKDVNNKNNFDYKSVLISTKRILDWNILEQLKIDNRFLAAETEITGLVAT